MGGSREGGKDKGDRKEVKEEGVDLLRVCATVLAFNFFHSRVKVIGIPPRKSFFN